MSMISGEEYFEKMGLKPCLQKEIFGLWASVGLQFVLW